MGKRLFTLIFLLSISYFSCVPESKKILTEVEANPNDPVYQAILTHQYSEKTDSLLQYLKDDNPTYRYLAARAFASFQEPSALDSLKLLLNDPILKVRSMAAYSIGQIADPNSANDLIAGFRQRDTMSVDNSANGAILEAIGKLGDKKLAEYLVNAQGYRDTDTLLSQGRMKSIYRFGLRGITSPALTELAVNTVRNYNLDNTTRLYAAHYLARSNDLNIDKQKFQIAEAFIDESDVNIKIALALALRHTDDKEIQTTLLDQLELEQDYRIKCNIIRALASYEYIDSAEKITNLIKDKNIHIARSAVSFLDRKGIKEDVLLYRQIAKDTLPWQVKADLYKTINNLLPYYYTKTINATRWHIQKLIEKETDTVALAHYIRSLSNDPGAYQYLVKYSQENDNSILKTAIVETYSKMLSSDNFNGTFQGYARFHRRKILEEIKLALLSNDEGMIGAAADAIANPNTFLTELIDSTEFLFEAKEMLKNPAQIESIHAIDRAIANIRGVTKPTLEKVEGAIAPDWDLIKEYDQNTTAIVKTTKGTFTIQLFLNESPGTVLNFLKLSTDNFYDDKIFHRVVPNFVIQTGSPRGDNYGGKDYVIKSDVSPLYYDDGGYVGMASAGLHTESTQWFVTHSPTPHLDGKYSIFGKVTEGMDVIHNIQVGDKILDIIISNI
ncbi:MAG: hypothetical protein HKN51_13560 [Saprospiraceae bacterium]|nr:hypothetical protein [Saprospiraceae bacterium]